MSPAQRGARLLRALGAEPALIRTLVAEVWRWPPVGALDVDDLWAIAIRTAWHVRHQQPSATAGFVRTRVKWALSAAVDRERVAKGWWRPPGQPWQRPMPPMARPVWDWGRPFLWSQTSRDRQRAASRRGGQARAAKMTPAERSAAMRKVGAAGARASAAQRTPAERSALARKAALAGAAKRRAAA